MSMKMWMRKEADSVKNKNNIAMTGDEDEDMKMEMIMMQEINKPSDKVAAFTTEIKNTGSHLAKSDISIKHPAAGVTWKFPKPSGSSTSLSMVASLI
ncbi:hypothetical protein AVEN_65786-1 [Araneus ventricosus]|uniref:Uncharacterized protein n=1 Tax=Araneus ventricosus TaxID=182803 RepID=A0A4Y2UB87_ARAVE|nr:hypothetical protein AVEN_65786-1 [Araneus ventricosus]